MSPLNLPVILTFRDIANLVERMAMFYFIKGLSVFRIVTEPCADRFLMLGTLAVALHDALDVGDFREGGILAAQALRDNLLRKRSAITPRGSHPLPQTQKKAARRLLLAERAGFEPITLTAYISATLLSKFQIGNETVTIFNR